MLGDVKKFFFCFQKFVDHAQLKPTFPPTIWIFTEDEGDEIKFRLPFNIFSTLQSQYILALNKVWFLFLFFSAGISTSFADWPRFCYKNTSSLRWKSQHSIELKTEAWKTETEQNFFLPLHYIHNYILCLHDFTIDMDSIQKCNSAYKKGVKDISSHEKFVLFRFSRLC